MLHSFTLLIATLAVTALAAPAPLWNLKSFGNSGAKDVHAFKASSRGHGLRGHRNPLTELSRIYNKFHWSVSLPTMDGTLTFELPPSGSSSSQGSDYGSYGGSDGGSSSGPSYGSGNGSDSGSAGASDSPPNVYSTAMTASATAAPAFTTAASMSQQLSYSQAATATASAAASSSPSAAPSDGSETGEVTASPEENESEYLSPVTIGGQKLNLNFDTGSADLWVFSTSLSESERGQHSVFDPTKSSTWKEYEGGEWQIQYGDGSGASGTVGYDTVDVGGATVTGQAVELATQISSAFVSDENNDGLLGLAFGKINTVQPEAQKTFFENIADDLDEKVFTADLDIDASGTYEFGKVDTSKYQGELHTTPIDNSNGFWQFESSSYSIGGKDSQSSNASPAIADTGTSLMMVDDAVAEAYYAQIDGAQMSEQAGGYVYPCDADVPSFGVAIGSSGFMAHINGSDIEYARVGSNSCFGGVQGNSGQGLQIFGAVLLKQYFAVFNFGDETFGLALKAEGADSSAQQQQQGGGADAYGEGSAQGYYKVR